MFLSSCLKAEETHLITPLNLHSLQLSPQETSRFTFNDTPKYTTYKSIKSIHATLYLQSISHIHTGYNNSSSISTLHWPLCRPPVTQTKQKPGRLRLKPSSAARARARRARARVASRRAHKTQQRLAATARALLAHLYIPPPLPSPSSPPQQRASERGKHTQSSRMRGGVKLVGGGGGGVAATSSSAAAGGGGGHPGMWRTPTPYLFLGFAVMMGLIAVALLVLVCMRRKNHGDAGSSASAAASVKVLVPLDREPKVVVIMAGDTAPSFLASAKPLSSFVLPPPPPPAAAGEP